MPICGMKLLNSMFFTAKINTFTFAGQLKGTNFFKRKGEIK